MIAKIPKLKYSFLTAPIDNIITNTIINTNVYLLEHHLNCIQYGVMQYLITIGLIKKVPYVGTITAAYMLINSLRATIYWNGLHSSQLFGLELTSYDPTFILPIFFGLFNYILIKSATHKELKTMQNDRNQLKMVNICFMSSLAVVGLPVDIIIIYLSMAGCQILRQMGQRYQRRQLLKNTQINI